MESQLLTGELNPVEKVAQLAAIRKRIWDAHRQVEEAKEAARESQIELEAMYRRKLELETRLAYYDEEANNLSMLEGEYDFLELVPLEEFLADNPEINADTMEPLELMAARVDDEERRRVQLFGQRIALNEQVKELEAARKAQLTALEFKGRFVDSFNRLEQQFRRLGEFIIQ